MSVWETVLVFVGIPAAAYGLLALLTLGPGLARSPRYRPGRAWEHEPVWYLAHPGTAVPEAGEHRGSAPAEPEPGRRPPGQPAPGTAPAQPALAGPEEGAAAGDPAAAQTARGGASGQW